MQDVTLGNCNFTYHLGSVETSCEMNNLGVIIDKELKYHAHTLQTVSKVNRLLGIISKTFSGLDTNIFSYLYKTIIRPVIEYGNIV